MIATVCTMFVASHVSGIWSGNVTHVQRVLDFNYHDLGHGQWWRIVTPNLTNGPVRHDFGPPGLPHLLANVVGLLMAGPFVERRLGGARYAVLVVVAGAVAYGWLVLPLPLANHFDGTSGSVFGVLGALTALTLLHFPAERWARVGLVLVALYVLSGFVGQPTVTKEIHTGGFAAGFALGLVFARFRRPVVVLGTALATVIALLVLVGARTSQIRSTETKLLHLPNALATSTG
jgi:membrane associated rhomboid family serine protease